MTDLKPTKMKATKKQIAEVTRAAEEMNFSAKLAVHTLANCSTSIYNAIGAKGVVESSMRANSKYFVDTLELAKRASRMDVGISELMTPQEIAVNI
jgi:hypothetical protein